MKKNRIETLLLVIYAAVLITSVSICAPQRIFTDFVDINIIFTVGKSLWKGLIVYRDLFEHKGPLMYAITALAALVSKTSFLGVWIIEIIAAAAFLLISRKIIRRINPDASLFLLPVIAFFIYRSEAFVGGTAEEFCLPLLAGALYIGVDASLDSRMPSFKESVLLGITSAVVFWIKYNMIGFYIGFLLIFILFAWKDHAWKKLLTAAGGAVTGFLIVTLPILVFFGINHAIDDLYQVYFYDNIHNYANRLDFLYQGYYTLTGTLSTVRANLLCWGFIVLGIAELIFIRKNARLVLFTLFAGGFTAWFVYCGGMKFNYYGFILLVFAVFAAAFEPLPKNLQKSAVPFAAAIVCTGILAGTGIRPADPERVRQMPQYVLAEQIKEKDASLLTYDYFDAGFYLTSGLYPKEYHFTLTNCVIDQASEAQWNYIEEARPDYIVTMEDLSFAGAYEQIAQCEDWALYKKKS